jgi:hypothetical protein
MLVYRKAERINSMTPNQKMREAIEDVEAMSYAELKVKFHSFFGETVCPLNARTLKNRLIYKIQEMYIGGISTEDLQLLSDITKHKELMPESETAIASTAVVHYVREWKGKRYDVIEISDSCYELEGKQYKSLSAVARAITGTRWNGKIFFGVKK